MADAKKPLPKSGRTTDQPVEREPARAADQSATSGADDEAMARTSVRDGDSPHGLLTLVCLTCGNHKYFEERPPDSVRCDKCGGTVFRNFFTPTDADEATLSQLEETARSIALDEESPDISADEVRDLNNP
jgi:hypothetical protein